jgi:hypothetical protein
MVLQRKSVQVAGVFPGLGEDNSLQLMRSIA